MTGGAFTARASEFCELHADRLYTKPLELEALRQHLMKAAAAASEPAAEPEV